jgi:two-component system response regulator FlrC
MKKVLIVEDDDTLRDALADTVELANYIVVKAANGQQALDELAKQQLDIVVTDVRMDGMDGHQLLKEIHRFSPGLPVILMTAHGTINNAVDAMRHGASDYILKPFEGEILLENIAHHAVNDEFQDDSNPVVKDPKSLALISLANKVSVTDATVLISGESGTGKEVMARFIHDHSPRKDKPFIAINCAAIPEQMLEATLFGYEKGAFTGAYKATPGKFEQANEGTLLLDEISEMDLALQAKLLRVLQEREVERIGGSKLIPLNVRVLATNNRNMKEEVANNRFREDLYYRLNVFPLHWLPLRERSQDIIPLAEYLIQRHWSVEKGLQPSLSDEAKQALEHYTWPGNAREMDNVIQRALILHTGNIIQLADLQLLTEDQTSVTHIDVMTVKKKNNNDLADSKKQHEFDLIVSALEDHQGNRKEVAEKLGVSERTLRYKLAEMRKQGYEV